MCCRNRVYCANERGCAPGPDAVPFEVGIMAKALTDWCANKGMEYLPRIGAESVLYLIPKAGGGGR